MFANIAFEIRKFSNNIVLLLIIADCKIKFPSKIHQETMHTAKNRKED